MHTFHHYFLLYIYFKTIKRENKTEYFEMKKIWGENKHTLHVASPSFSTPVISVKYSAGNFEEEISLTKTSVDKLNLKTNVIER